MITAESILLTVEVAVDKAKENLRGVGAEGESLASRFVHSGALMAGGLLVGVGAAVELGKQILETTSAAEAQQNIMSQVTQALKSTHDASGLTAEGLAQLGDKFSGMTTFSKQAYEQANLMMLQFTHIGKDTFPQADLAAANLSTRFGIGLSGAARLVGMALDNPVQGVQRLTRYIGPLDAATKENIKTLVAHGETAQAQAVILNLLSEKFGGAAVAAGQTFSGAMTIAKQRLEEAKVSVVSAFLPSVTDMMNTLNTLAANIFSKVAPAMDAFGTILESKVKEGLGVVTSVAGTLHTAFAGLGTVIGTIAQMFGVSFVTGTDQVNNALHKVTDTTNIFKGIFGPAIDFVRTMWQKFVDLVKPGVAWSDILEPFYTGAGKLGAALGGLVQGAFKTFSDLWKQIQPQLVAAKPAFDSIVTSISDLMAQLAPFAKAFGPIISIFQNIPQDVATLAPAFVSVIPAIASLLKSLSQIADSVIPLVGTFGNLTSILTSQLLPLVAKLIPPIATLAATIGVQLARSIEAVTPPLTKAITAMTNDLEPIIASLIIALGNFIPMVAVGLTNALTTILPIITGVVTWIGNLLSQMDKGTPVGNALKDVLFAVAGAWAAWKIGNITVDLAKAVIALGENTAAFVTHTAAVVADRIETLQIQAMLAGDWVVNLVKSGAALAVHTGQWIAHTASVVFDWLAVKAYDLTGLISSFISSIPVIAAQTGAWIANAVAVVAATWPILAIIAGIAAVIAIGVLLVTHWKQVTDFIHNVFVTTLDFLRDHWQLIASIIGGPVVAAGIYLVTHWTQITGVLTKLWGDITNAVSGAINAVVGWITNVWGGLVKTVTDIWTNIVNAVVGAFQTAYNHSYLFKAIVDAITGYFTNLWNDVQTIWGLITDFLSATWNGIKTAAAFVWAAISTVLTTLWNNEMNGIQFIWTTISGWLSTTWNTIKSVATTVWNAILGVLTTIGDAEIRAIQTVWNTLSGWLSTVWNGIKGAATTIWTALVTAVERIIQDDIKAIQTVWNTMSGWISGLWNGIKNTAATVWGDITGTIGKAVQNVYNTVVSIWSSISSTASNWASSMWNGFISGVTGAWTLVTTALHKFIGDGNSKAGDGSVMGFIKQVLGIHSPSDVMAQIGQMVILGFIRGMTGSDLASNIGAFIANSLGGIGNVAAAALRAGLIDLTQIPVKGWDFLKGLGVDVTSFMGSLFGGGGGASAAIPAGAQVMPGAAGMSEFMGYFGDCTQTAILTAMHVLRGWPLSGGLLNTIVKQSQRDWGSASDGSMDVPQLYNELVKSLSATATNVTGSWQSAIANLAGIKPFIFQVREGHFLPGDERGLHGHAFSILGRAGGSFLAADGDNPISIHGGLVPYTLGQLISASPFNVTLVDTGNTGATPPANLLPHNVSGPPTPYATGGWITEPVTGIGLHTGRGYSFAENEAEYVSPGGAVRSRGAPVQNFTVHVHGDMQESTAAKIASDARWQLLLHSGFTGAH